MTGTLLGGRYRVEKLLGLGEIGSTFLAYDTILGTDITVKLAHFKPNKDKESFSYFYNTFHAYIDLEHNNIVKALDSGLTTFKRETKENVPEEQTPFLVFEYFPGKSIGKLLKGKPFPIETALKYFLKILDIIKYMHEKGFIHRAIKSNNILINDQEEIKLVHFGVFPKKLKPIQSRKEWMIQKEVAIYESPEITKGSAGDERSDLYSLGIILFQLLTGKVPFYGNVPEDILVSHMNNPPPPLRMFNPLIPQYLENVVSTLLKKDPASRFQCVSDLIKKIKEHEKVEKLYFIKPQEVEVYLSDFPINVPYIRRRKLERYIKDFIRSCARGRLSLLFIKGTSGIGKNRIAEEIGAYSRLLGVEFYHGRSLKDICPPYEPFIGIVRELLLKRNARLSEIMELSFDRVLSTLLGERGFRAIETEDPNRPFVLEHQAMESFHLFFKRMATDNMMIIYLEDIQWCDESALKLLEYLVIHENGERIVILATYSEDSASKDFLKYKERLSACVNVRELEIPPLSTSECEYLLKNFSGAPLISAEFTRAIAKKSKGNPLYVIEALRYLIPDKRIFYTKDGLLCDLDDLAKLPDFLFDVVIRRIVNLPAQILEFYKMAAAIGKKFTFKVLQEAMGKVQEEVLLGLLERGKKLGFHREDKDRKSYMFSHTIYRDAFYDMIPQNERKERHATIGNIIEEIHFNNLVDYFEELITHFNLAYDDDKTIRYMIKVANKSMLAGAYSRAIKFYEESLNLIGGRLEKNQERWKCFRNLGIIYQRLKNFEKALEYQMKALDLSEKKRELLTIQESLFLIADIYMEIGDNKKASEIIENALDYETLRDNIWKCKLLSRRGKLAMLNNYKEISLEDALYSVKESFNIAQDLRNVDAAIETSEILAEIYIDQNIEEEADKAFSKILRYKTGPETRIRILERLGKLYMFPGSDYKKALHYLKEGLQTATKSRDVESTGIFSSHLGSLFSQIGDLNEAMRFFKKAIDLQKEKKPSGLARTYAYMADLHYIKGNLKYSRKLINRSSKLLKADPDGEIVSDLYIRQGYIKLLEGELDDAINCFEKAKEISLKMEYFKGIFFSLLGLSETYIKEENLFSARINFVEASRRNKKGKNWFGNAYLTMLQGLVFRIDKSYETAFSLLSHSHEIFEKLGRPYELGLVNLEKARTYNLIDGEEDKAIDCYKKAKEYFSSLNNKFMVSHIREEMKQKYG